MAVSEVRVWSYWEGSRPTHIKICLDSLFKVLGDSFTLVTPETADTFLEGCLNSNWKLLSQPALRADALRAALLAKHGGWWWDADTIAFKKPDFLHDRYPEASALYASWTKLPTRVLNGYIWLPKNSSIALEWLGAVNKALDHPEEIDWLSIGEKLLTKLLVHYPKAVKLHRTFMLPIDIDSDVKLFFEKGSLKTYLDLDPMCFGLNHSWFMYHKPVEMNLPVEKWPSSPLLIHKLLQYALIS